MLWLIVIVLVLLFVDQYSKYLFFDHQFASHTGLFEPVFNNGISFGIEIHTIIVGIISVVVFFGITFLWYRKVFDTIFACFFLAGLVGNFVDRLYLGGVRDFIVFGPFFVFNIADLYLSLALLWLFVQELGILPSSMILSGKSRKVSYKSSLGSK